MSKPCQALNIHHIINFTDKETDSEMFGHDLKLHPSLKLVITAEQVHILVKVLTVLSSNSKKEQYSLLKELIFSIKPKKVL